VKQIQAKLEVHVSPAASSDLFSAAHPQSLDDCSTTICSLSSLLFQELKRLVML
jgi:hypothetical protein